MDFLVRGGLDFQGQFSVVEQDGVPPLHFFRQTGVVHMGLFRRPFHILRGEDEFMAGHQGGLVPFEQPQTHFRAFGIGHIAHQAPCFLFRFLQQVQPGFTFAVGAMGEVEPGQIHPGADHIHQQFFFVRGRPQGADDFCFLHEMFPL